MKAPFVITPQLTAIAIAYRNALLIADEVFPIVPVGTEDFKWMEFNNEDLLTIPTTRVGRKGKRNEVEFGATEVTSSTLDYGLDSVVPQKDVDNAPAGYNPINIAAEGVMKLVKLDREVRVRDILFDTANYLPDNTQDLTATPFSANTTDAVEVIHLAKEGMLATANQATFSQNAWAALQTNPFILKAVHRNDGDSGIASKVAIEELFDLKIVIGKARHNTSKKGQTPTLSRVWQDDVALQFIDETASIQNPSLTHGFTARFGQPIGGEYFDPSVGLKGATAVMAGEQVRELVVSKDCGYLLRNAA